MRVSDLAKDLGITSDVILTKLKSLHLKAKDGKQELSDAAIAVLRRELKNIPKAALKPKEGPGPAKTESKAATQGKEIKESKAAKTGAQEKKGVKKPIEKKEKESKVVQKRKPQLKKVIEKRTPSISKKVLEMRTAVVGKAPSAPSPAKGVELPLREIVKPLEKPTVKKTEIKEKPLAQVVLGKPPLPKAESKKQEPPREEIKKKLGEITLLLPISVKDLAVRIQEKPSVVLKKLMQMNILANINQNLGEEIVKKLGEEFGFILAKAKTQEEQLITSHRLLEEDKSRLKSRSPVVTFMGHVDHGKTSLLDRIRKTKVADSEHGGITQHIGAYSVSLPKGRITFLDTPGHEAFTAMRARGAHITDLVVLVVAADEGVMPQTEEAIDHARAANVPIVVALNKIDKKNINIDIVKKQLAEKGLAAEDWGGKTIVVGVSAVTGEGIDNLLEMILLEAEILELKANYEKKASGIVVEAKLSRGKGPIATVIVQNGVLKENDAIVVGPYYGKIKAMFDDRERPIKEAGPAAPAEIFGLSGVPEAGEMFYAVEDERQTREISAKRQEALKNQKMQPLARITLEDLYAQVKEGKIKELNIILKADVQGSLEAMKDSLQKLSTDEVQLKIIHAGVGEINASDIILAGASNAIIIGFNMEVGERAKEELEKQSIDVRTYRIIYDAIKDVKNALEGLLEPKLKKKFLGRVEIRQVFNLSRSGTVAGCFVAKGKIHRKVNIDIVRNGGVVFSGNLSSLKRFKDDVREVAEGFECGITINGFQEIQAGDIIEAYEIERIAQKI